MTRSTRRPAHAPAGGAAGADRCLADEFYGLYAQVRLMLVREFEDKGMPRADAVAAAQAFLNRLMLALFVGTRRGSGAGGVGDGIAGVLEGGIGDGTRRVWDYIVGDAFAASGAGRAQPPAEALGGACSRSRSTRRRSFPTRGAGSSLPCRARALSTDAAPGPSTGRALPRWCAAHWA